MRILWYIVAVFLLVMVAYICDMIITAGNLINNLLTMYGITGEPLIQPMDTLIISVIYFAISAISIAVLIHISRSIRRREV